MIWYKRETKTQKDGTRKRRERINKKVSKSMRNSKKGKRQRMRAVE